MAVPTINIDDLLAAVTEATGLADSAVVLLEQNDTLREEAIRAALAAEDITDQAEVDRIIEASKAPTEALKAASARLKTALQANPAPGEVDPNAPLPVDPNAPQARRG